MKIFMTGATARIGAQLIRALSARGHNIRAVIRPDSSARPATIRGLEKLQGVTILRKDLSDFESVQRAMRGVDVVYHLAWPTGSEREQLDVEVGMVRITETLLRASIKARVAGFVFTSSVSVYGPENRWPSRPIKEHAVLLGNGLYARGKIEAEKLIQRYATDYDLCFSILRLSLVYGPGVQYVERFVNQALSYPGLSAYWNDHAYFQLIHLRDAARALVAASKIRKENNGVFNVAGNEIISQAELADMVNRVARRFPDWSNAAAFSSHERTGRPLKYDISKARELLGFVPKVNLQQGLSEILNRR